MVILELETSEGVYICDMVRDQHFMINCACGGRNGKYGGSHYKGLNRDLDRITEESKDSQLFREKEHTFFINETLFLMELNSKSSKSTIIVCNDCGREFKFTSRSYHELKDNMRKEYSRRLLEADKSTEN